MSKMSRVMTHTYRVNITVVRVEQELLTDAYGDVPDRVNKSELNIGHIDVRGSQLRQLMAQVKAHLDLIDDGDES